MGVSAPVGIGRRLRWQIDRKNSSFMLATWAMTVAAVGWGAWEARHGGGADTAAYFVCLASITLSILLTTFDSPVENAVISLIFVGFPLMAIASALVPPDAGYFGQTLRFCFTAVVAVIVGASYAAKGLRKDTVDKDKAYSQLFLWHLGVVLVFVLASSLTSAPSSPGSARQLSNGLVITPVKVATGQLSLPFVLGDRCYIVSQYGSLAEIDLNRGEVTASIGLPEPNTLELGLEGYGVEGGRGLPHQALFYGDPGGKVQFAYPFPLEVKKDGKAVTDWSNYIWVDVTLPLPPGYSFAEWRLGEEPVGEAISLRDPGPGVFILEFGDSIVDRTPPPNPTSVKEIKTITPDGEASFNLNADWHWAVVAGENRVLISTFFGYLYIVTRVR